MSRFSEILSEVPESDRTIVALEARAHMNMCGGGRPSSFARMAVDSYKRGEITRESFCAARLNSSFYPNFKCVCGTHGEAK